MESGSLMVDFKPGVPPLVLKIEKGESSSNLADVANAAFQLAKTDRSPDPGIIEFLKEWTQLEATKEFKEKADKTKTDEQKNMEANLQSSHQAPPPIHGHAGQSSHK